MRAAILSSLGRSFPIWFAHPTLAQNEPGIHQALFTNVNVFDGTGDKLAMGQDVLIAGDPIEDLLLLMNTDKISVVKDGKIYKKAYMRNPKS